MSDDRQLALAQRILDIREISEGPQFAYQLGLARELGLLAPLLAGQREAVASRASELIASLREQMRLACPIDQS
jgi:hypothetical protein